MESIVDIIRSLETGKNIKKQMDHKNLVCRIKEISHEELWNEYEEFDPMYQGTQVADDAQTSRV